MDKVPEEDLVSFAKREGRSRSHAARRHRISHLHEAQTMTSYDECLRAPRRQQGG